MKITKQNIWGMLGILDAGQNRRTTVIKTDDLKQKASCPDTTVNSCHHKLVRLFGPALYYPTLYINVINVIVNIKN